MKLYVVQAGDSPHYFFKCVSAQYALQQFMDALKEPDKYPNPTAQLVTMELLMEIAPDEFQLCPNVDF